MAMLLTALSGAILVVACATTNADGTALSANQQAINAAVLSYKGVDTAITQATVAATKGELKGNDLHNVTKGLTDAKSGLDIALVGLRAANAAASAASATSGVKP